MCLSPIKIPYYKQTRYSLELGSLTELPEFLSPSTSYIEVGCGKCPECRNTYFNSLIQRALVESMSSYMYFVTLTYDDKHIPSLILPTGDIVYYYDYTHIVNMFKRFRKYYTLDRDFRYMCVNEYGDKTSRPHAHLLIFVAKLPTDDDTTPYYIEKYLFDNIKLHYTVNIGTKFAPKYEPLFTYCCKPTKKGLHTNYYVKYVSSQLEGVTLHSDVNITYYKTIKYLVGYLNKGSSFDDYVLKMLEGFSDTKLLQVYKSLIRCRVRFSRGFGCGFVNGKKYFLPKIFIKSSLTRIMYSDVYYNTDVDSFSSLYPDIFQNLLDFINSDRYSNFDSLRDCLNTFNTEQIYYHLLFLRLFPKDFALLYNFYFVHNLEPKISLFFRKFDFKYYYAPISTSAIISDSPIINFLRRGIEYGFSNAVPFFVFLIDGLPVQSLCEYYRQRILTVDDYLRLYSSCSVTNFEQLQSKFIDYRDNLKQSISAGNKFKYFSEDKICNSQSKTISSHHQLSTIDLYRRVL